MDVDVKELALYNYFNNLTAVTYHINVENSYDSVQNLMQKFVENLQVSYPSTITTIVKTAEKLINQKQQKIVQCAFCKVQYNHHLFR